MTLYNVTMLDHFWPPVVPRLGIWDAVKIGNSFLFTISRLHNYNHNYLLLFCAFTQLQSLHANIPFYSLTVFITHLTSSHVHTSRVCLLPRTHSSNWLLQTDFLDIPVPLIKLSIVQASLLPGRGIYRPVSQQRVRWGVCYVTRGNAKVTWYYPTPGVVWRHRGMLRRNRMVRLGTARRRHRFPYCCVACI
jgi:hypothetical protein